MGATINGLFLSRGQAEIAIEHLVQEYGIERSDIFVAPADAENSAGAAGQGQLRTDRDDPDDEMGAHNGPLRVSVDVNHDEVDDVRAAFDEAGAVETEIA